MIYIGQKKRVMKNFFSHIGRSTATKRGKKFAEILRV
jgi:hypothetical protein